MIDAADLRELARGAALVGAAEVRERGADHALEVEGKGLPGDWVTQTDIASELAIEAFLATRGPAIAFHGEETGGPGEGLRWVVDPLDGTTNFVHGFPAVGVSVALVDDDRVLAGAIAAPFLGDVWHAVRDGRFDCSERARGVPPIGRQKNPTMLPARRQLARAVTAVTRGP